MIVRSHESTPGSDNIELSQGFDVSTAFGYDMKRRKITEGPIDIKVVIPVSWEF